MTYIVPPRPSNSAFMSEKNVKQQQNGRRLSWTAAVRLCLGAGLISLFGINYAPAATLSAAQKALFEDKVLPVLQGKCFECHSHAGHKMKGGLVLDTLGGFITGGNSGPAIVLGKPDESLIIKAIKHTDDHLKMPSKKPKLSDEEISYLVEWVREGAPWPGADLSKIKPRGKITDEDRQWWSFQPLKQPPVPTVKDGGWSKNELDRFIFARLEKEGLKPAGEAERGALIRRVTFDLTGLPPTPGEVDNFLHDTSSNAYEKLIDRLLSSPRYGERWARYWLDLVRYADSDGYRIDDYRPLSWRYRDYVIKSFNTDKPYNLFVKEQLAGDELYPNNPEALIATGFLRHGIY
ncbi:MAG: Planctomycete cytochrome, partial [Verrucomicrobia bacterium]|nr:Planctomycete cytochrome [Verrucomicrobiota bacterium]